MKTKLIEKSIEVSELSKEEVFDKVLEELENNKNLSYRITENGATKAFMIPYLEQYG